MNVQQMSAHYSQPLARLGKCDSSVLFERIYMKKFFSIVGIIVVAGVIFVAGLVLGTQHDFLNRIKSACQWDTIDEQKSRIPGSKSSMLMSTFSFKNLKC